MKIIISLFFAFITLPLVSLCQKTEKIANEAFVLTRMAAKFHVDARPVDAAFSATVFKAMLNKADEDKMLFTQKDISLLNRYKNTLDDEIKHRKANYLNLFITIYTTRLQHADSLLAAIGKTTLNFYLPETLTVAEDTSYPASIAAIKVKLYKKIKANVLEELADDLPGDFKNFAPVRQKKYTDSITAVLQNRLQSYLKRKINSILQNPYGITQYAGNMYCEAIASGYDPHTEFFPPAEKENFESALGKQPFQFGFKLKPDKSGGVLIENLQPGSPAYKSGKLNRGDKFITLQWEGSPAVDIADITIREFTQLIDESNHKKVVFTIKKIDGAVIQVPLQKELAVNDDESKVKSFVLKGNGTAIGYIYLPAFILIGKHRAVI